MEWFLKPNTPQHEVVHHKSIPQIWWDNNIPHISTNYDHYGSYRHFRRPEAAENKPFAAENKLFSAAKGLFSAASGRQKNPAENKALFSAAGSLAAENNNLFSAAT
jgi:hypothetical protein